MPSPSMEQLVGRTLAGLLREQRLDPRELERRLDLPAASLEPLLAGRVGVDVEVLRRVLTVMGLSPEALFARVFAAGTGGENDAPSPAPPGRPQVAALLDRVRSALTELGSEVA